MTNIVKTFFTGGDTGTPHPTVHTLLGFVRSAALFLLVFVAQYALDAATHNKDLGALTTWTDLLPFVVYIFLEFFWRYLRAVSSPLTPVVKLIETQAGAGLENTPPIIPETIDINLPVPPES